MAKKKSVNCNSCIFRQFWKLQNFSKNNFYDKFDGEQDGNIGEHYGPPSVSYTHISAKNLGQFFKKWSYFSLDVRMESSDCGDPLKLGPHDAWFVFVMHEASWFAHRVYEKMCLIWVESVSPIER